MPIKKLAITSLVFGILAMAFSRGLIGLASALIAIVIGSIALYAMKQSGDITGRKKALCGLGLGILSVIILIIVVAVGVRTQRAVDGLRESHPELFNAYTEKPESKNDAQSFYDKGLMEFGQKNWYAALAYFQKATEEKPDNATTHCWIGLTYDNLGRYQEAIEAYKQAIRIETDYDDAYYHLGVTYAFLDRYREAMEAYKQAIRISPDYAEAYFGLGGAYSGLGRYQDAIGALKKAIRIEPDDIVAHYNLGVAYSNAGDKGSALEEYKILKTLNAEWANRLFNWIYESPASQAYEAALSQYTRGLAREQVLTPVQIKMQQKVNVDFRETPIEDVLRLLAKQGGIDIIKSTDVIRFNVTATLTDMPLAEVLYNILAAHGYGYIAYENMIRIVPYKEVVAHQMNSPVSAVPEKNVITGIAKGSSVLIGGKIVDEGQYIGDVKVVKIYKWDVEFEKNGKRWKQQVGESPNSAWQE